MQSLSVKSLWSIGWFLLFLTGCIAPQQAVQLRIVDAETNLPLRQVEITQYNASRSSVLPDVPVYGYAGRKAGPPEVTRQVVHEQWRTTLPGNSQVLLSKDGYQPVRIEPKTVWLARRKHRHRTSLRRTLARAHDGNQACADSAAAGGRKPRQRGCGIATEARRVRIPLA